MVELCIYVKFYDFYLFFRDSLLKAYAFSIQFRKTTKNSSKNESSCDLNGGFVPRVMPDRLCFLSGLVRCDWQL